MRENVLSDRDGLCEGQTPFFARTARGAEREKVPPKKKGQALGVQGVTSRTRPTEAEGQTLSFRV